MFEPWSGPAPQEEGAAASLGQGLVDEVVQLRGGVGARGRLDRRDQVLDGLVGQDTAVRAGVEAVAEADRVQAGDAGLGTDVPQDRVRGNSALFGRTATKTGLSASLIFLARAFASALDSWPVARGSTYTGLFFSAAATVSGPVAACAAGAATRAVAENASNRPDTAVNSLVFILPTLPEQVRIRTSAEARGTGGPPPGPCALSRRRGRLWARPALGLRPGPRASIAGEA